MFSPQIEWKPKIDDDVVLWEMWRSGVIKKMERGGACFTPIEQGDDGDCFGGGGVVGRSAVVMVLGWLPAATKERRGKRKR